LTIQQREHLLRPKEIVQRGCDPLSIQFHSGIDDMHPGEAEVVRIRQKMNGATIGGYTAVLIGK
jgi:hypothetical protein